MRGEDIEALQARLDKELLHREFPWRTIDTDGEFGRQTRNAAYMVAWLIGLNRKRLKAIKEGRITERVQEILRDPSQRGFLDRQRDKLRRKKARKLREAHATGPDAAARYIEEMAKKDVHEVGSSNEGPEVNVWSSFFGLRAVPWCGTFAGYAAKVIGGSESTTWFPYAGSIAEDARAGRNGLIEVSFDKIQRGDILVCWGDKHIATALDTPTGDSVRTGEGNTAPGPDGDQANGGSCEIKTRSRSDVTCVARPY